MQESLPMEEQVCIFCETPFPSRAQGTRHRNHCPFCLWSRHVDEARGDRKSSCCSPMEPIGLALKQDGEVMVVHQCAKCGKVSKNRIAGDDREDAILQIQEKGRELSQETKEKLQSLGVVLCEERMLAQEALWGR